MTTSTTPRLAQSYDDYLAMLKTMFSQVCDPDDWKNPINALVPYGAAPVYIKAIKLMTGAPCECRRSFVKGKPYAHITSVGYRAGPAGDH